jgi:glycosyltransferase involved in cell wall biosynthesis
MSIMPPPTLSVYRAQLATITGQPEGGLRTRGQFLKTGSADNPLVSIITIVRNGDATLERAIKSVLAQDYAPIEYIVVDGGSTDRTLPLIKGYENELAYWRSEPDKGISDAFNKGIALTSGDIIGMINADDWYEQDAVATAVHSLQANNAEIVHGMLQLWQESRKGELCSGGQAKLEQMMCINHPTVFVKRDVYLRHGLFELDYCVAMDYEWLLRVKTAGVRFFYIDKLLANMQCGGLSNARWKQSFRETAQAKTRYFGGYFRHQLFYFFLVGKRNFIDLADENILAGYLLGLYRQYLGLLKNK